MPLSSQLPTIIQATWKIQWYHNQDSRGKKKKDTHLHFYTTLPTSIFLTNKVTKVHFGFSLIFEYYSMFNRAATFFVRGPGAMVKIIYRQNTIP